MPILSKKNGLICLVGIDGSGKTVHSRRMIAHLKKCGRKCKYVWLGTAYFFSYPFMIGCRILGLTKTHHLANNFAVSEHQYYKNKPVSLIWPWIQSLDAAIFVNLRVKPALWSGSTVVCDRFIPDILVELMSDTRDDKLLKKLVGRLMLSLMPRSTTTILLDVTEGTAWNRKSDVPNMQYLTSRRTRYNLICKELRISRINAEQSFAIVQGRLLTQVNGEQRLGIR